MSKKLLFIILVISQNTFAQKTTKSNYEFLKLNGKKVPYVFVGKTNLYACQFEVSNYEYLCFLDWIRKTKGENEYQKNLPDTLVWRSPLGYNEKYCIYYFRHPAFRDYPVIGVSYEQALNYCNWLTITTNQLLKDKKIKKIQFRLPSEEEWELAARGGMPEGTVFPWGTSSYRVESGKLKGYIRANFNTGYSDNFGLAGTLNDGSDITVSKSEFWPNNYGLYNIAGNVAEMVTEKSICKGGSWYKGSHKMVISTRDTFEIADSWVGMRVFAETEEYQIPESKLNIDASFIQDNLCYIPSGGLQINGYGRTMHDTTDVISQHSFYMSKFEVSNELYVAFLNSISDSSIQKAYYPKDENWYSETDLIQYQHYTSQFPNHPVVNITKDAMIAFCKWLTDRYNNDPLRRYEYVEFSLPTLEQQLVASSCGLNLCPFSWGGPYKMNAKGEYMMNFNPLLDYVRYDEKKLTNVSAYRRSQLAILKMSRALDGYELTAPVNAFYPCKYGMHNLNGNVAEVVSNSDIVFGGSFADMDENCSNFLIDNYYFLNEPERTSLPSPQVGFRFVMKGIYDQNKHKK